MTQSQNIPLVEELANPAPKTRRPRNSAIATPEMQAQVRAYCDAHGVRKTSKRFGMAYESLRALRNGVKVNPGTIAQAFLVLRALEIEAGAP